jgi:DNA replicative helicase MCM subunit Mcm2 (Cdc46/Mcm family)
VCFLTETLAGARAYTHTLELRQEARAKLELREVITAEMALDVVNLMRESMLDTLTDEFGGIDFGRTGGTSKKGESACSRE